MRTVPWIIARLVLLLAVGAVVAVGCGSDDDDGEVAVTDTTAVDETDNGEEVDGEATVEAEDPWARATAPGISQGAGYVVLTASVDDRLISASVSPDVAASMEIHETVMADDEGDDQHGEGGMGDDMSMGGEAEEEEQGHDMPSGMRMQEIEAIELPAGEAVSLEPGGLHLMFIDLVEPLVAGDTIEVTLEFEQAGTQVVTFEVRES